MAVMAAVAIFMYRSQEPASSSGSCKRRIAITSHAYTTEPESPAAQPAPARVKESKKPINTVRDLSGKWTVVNSIDTTAYGSFKNMKIGFDLSIDQTGSTFTGKGRKVSENGHSLPANSRTPIHVQGSINGDRIEATFIEEGSARKSNGKFVWRIDKSRSRPDRKFRHHCCALQRQISGNPYVICYPCYLIGAFSSRFNLSLKISIASLALPVGRFIAKRKSAR